MKKWDFLIQMNGMKQYLGQDFRIQEHGRIFKLLILNQR